MKLQNLISSVLVLPLTGWAGVLVTENFDYADGDLTGNPAWTAHSGGGGSPIQVSSSTAVLSHGSGSREDINTTFPAISTGTLSAMFSLTVNDDATVSGSDFEYFAHFGTGGGAAMSNFAARMDVVAPTNSVDFNFSLGIASESGTAEIVYDSDFTFGDQLTILLDYDLDTGLSSLTVNGGTTITTANAGSTGVSLTAFGLRQSNSSPDETITIDNLVISDSTMVPEPSTAILGSFALLGLLRRRR